jgi:hypothetical protein
MHDASARLQQWTKGVVWSDVQARINFKAQQPKVLRYVEADIQSREPVVG